MTVTYHHGNSAYVRVWRPQHLQRALEGENYDDLSDAVSKALPHWAILPIEFRLRLDGLQSGFVSYYIRRFLFCPEISIVCKLDWPDDPKSWSKRISAEGLDFVGSMRPIAHWVFPPYWLSSNQYKHSTLWVVHLLDISLVVTLKAKGDLSSQPAHFQCSGS